MHAIVTNATGAVVSFTTAPKSTGRDMRSEVRDTGYGGIVGWDKVGASKRMAWAVEQHTTVRLADILSHFEAPSQIDYLSLDVPCRVSPSNHLTPPWSSPVEWVHVASSIYERFFGLDDNIRHD